jgi:hypothetical protein
MTVMVSAGILALAWFAAVNVVASSASWLMARSLVLLGARRGAGLLLTIRLLPAVVSIFFVWSVFLPAHWRLEPVGTRESFGFVLSALATLSLILLLRSSSRACTVARVSWRLRAATQGSSALATDVAGMSAVTLAGLFRTRILIGPRVREALSSAELEVAVAHEVAHRRAWDNLKRCAIFCSPDLFGFSATARQMEQQWRAETECLADAAATCGDETRAINLASALVKVARLTADPPATPAPPVWSTFCERALIATRVQRLIDGERARSRSDMEVALLAVALLLVAGTVAWIGGFPSQLYGFTESLVTLLP